MFVFIYDDLLFITLDKAFVHHQGLKEYAVSVVLLKELKIFVDVANKSGNLFLHKSEVFLLFVFLFFPGVEFCRCLLCFVINLVDEQEEGRGRFPDLGRIEELQPVPVGADRLPPLDCGLQRAIQDGGGDLLPELGGNVAHALKQSVQVES